MCGPTTGGRDIDPVPFESLTSYLLNNEEKQYIYIYICIYIYINIRILFIAITVSNQCSMNYVFTAV